MCVCVCEKLIYLHFLLEFNIQLFLFKSLSKLSFFLKSCLANLITQYSFYYAQPHLSFMKFKKKIIIIIYKN